MEKKTTLRLSPELEEEVRVAIARRRVRSLQQAMEDALRLWLNGSTSALSVPASPDVPEEHAADVARYLRFLAEGSPDRVEAVKLLIEDDERKRKVKTKRAG